jgi:hypothetical protein
MACLFRPEIILLLFLICLREIYLLNRLRSQLPLVVLGGAGGVVGDSITSFVISSNCSLICVLVISVSSIQRTEDLILDVIILHFIRFRKDRWRIFLWS